MAAGAMVVVRGPVTFGFVDEVGTEADPVECGEACATPGQGGTSYRLGWNGGERGVSGGSTTLVVGAYPMEGEIG